MKIFVDRGCKRCQKDKHAYVRNIHATLVVDPELTEVTQSIALVRMISTGLLPTGAALFAFASIGFDGGLEREHGVSAEWLTGPPVGLFLFRF